MSVFSLINKQNNTVLANKETSLSIPISFTHAMITGQTGCGKTTSVILPAIDERIKANHAMLILDYKGVEHKKVKFLAQKYGRLRDVVMVNVPWGYKLNLMYDTNDVLLTNFFKKAFGTERDTFWGNLATNISASSLDMMKAIYDFSKSAFCSIKLCKKAEGIYPSFANLCKFTQQLSDFRNFYDTVLELSRYANDNKAIADNISSKIPTLYQPMLAENIWALNAFKQKSSKFLQAFKEHTSAVGEIEAYRARMFSNYTFMLQALRELADDEMLNEDITMMQSISTLLNQGKIVIINAQGLKDNVIELILNSTLSSMTRRILDEYKVPVSIFIDEAQRVLNPQTDLHADVLREAKVELILAFQNEDVLKNSLGGESKYKELVGNLSHQYFFKNHIKQYANGENKDFSGLKNFECYHEEKIYKTKPMFLDEKDLLNAELCYQKSLKLGAKYTEKELCEDEILVFHRQMAKDYGLIAVLNIKTKNTYFLPILSAKDKELLKSINNLVESKKVASSGQDIEVF